jgi:beta-barrel assembly-enhancing protease
MTSGSSSRLFSNFRTKFCVYWLMGWLVWAPVLSAYAQAQANGNPNLPQLGDVDGDELSTASERRLGRAIMQEIRREGVMLDDPEMNDWLNRFAAPLMRTRNAQGYSFELFFVRDRTINAFALPGGYIGVNTGLLETAATEGEVLSVLGHEIAHVTQRHIARQFGKERISSAMLLSGFLLGILAARANPQAAAGVMQLGQAAATGHMLSYSRDAEREADRLGLDMLVEAGYSAQSSVSFFTKLQAATRVYESAAPSYLRSHPLTSERVSDMQSRAMASPARIKPNSLEFALVKAKLKAWGDNTRSSWEQALVQFEEPLPNGDAQDKAVNHYGRAIALADLLRASEATAQLQEAARFLGAEHPMILGEQIRQAIKAQQAPQARELAEKAIKKYPQSRVFGIAKLDALALNKRWDEAASFARELLITDRSSPDIWRRAAEIYGQNNQPALAHQAAMENYALQGRWEAAIDQGNAAQRLSKSDFILSAILDTRLKEITDELKREKNDPMFARR